MSNLINTTHLANTIGAAERYMLKKLGGPSAERGGVRVYKTLDRFGQYVSITFAGDPEKPNVARIRTRGFVDPLTMLTERVTLRNSKDQDSREAVYRRGSTRGPEMTGQDALLQAGDTDASGKGSCTFCIKESTKTILTLTSSILTSSLSSIYNATNEQVTFTSS